VTREQKNAIISLSRLDDWKHLMSYVAEAVHGMEASVMAMDPTDSVNIARIQGARQSLVNILQLEESAHELNKQEDNDE